MNEVVLLSQEEFLAKYASVASQETLMEMWVAAHFGECASICPEMFKEMSGLDDDD